MDKPIFGFTSKHHRHLSLWASLACISILIFEYYGGNSFTNMVAILYSTFLLPSVLLTRQVQERYFLYTQEYVAAFRGFTTVMSLVFLSIWIISTCSSATSP